MARPAWWDDACAGLAAADPVMARLIASWPDAELVSRGEPFETLLRAIVGQQISVRAADAVWKRLSAVLSGQPSPERVLALPAVAAMQPDARTRRLHYDWMEAGEHTQRTVAALSQQLRRAGSIRVDFLNDKISFRC